MIAFTKKMTKQEKHDLVIHTIIESLMDMVTKSDYDEVNEFTIENIQSDIITFAEADDIFREFDTMRFAMERVK